MISTWYCVYFFYFRYFSPNGLLVNSQVCGGLNIHDVVHMTGAICLGRKTRDCWKEWMEFYSAPTFTNWQEWSKAQGGLQWFHLISNSAMNGMVDLATCLSCAVCPRVLKVICMNARRLHSRLSLYQFLKVSLLFLFQSFFYTKFYYW